MDMENNVSTIYLQILFELLLVFSALRFHLFFSNSYISKCIGDLKWVNFKCLVYRVRVCPNVIYCEIESFLLFGRVTYKKWQKGRGQRLNVRDQWCLWKGLQKWDRDCLHLSSSLAGQVQHPEAQCMEIHSFHHPPLPPQLPTAQQKT